MPRYSEQEDAAAKARRAVRTNNFTQQTNALDVDKHMYGPSFLTCASSSDSRIHAPRMAYIEENLRVRRQQDPSDPSTRDAKDDFTLSERWKTERKTANEGSVTNSLAMLTAIPEVDLGMECVYACF